MIQKSEILEAMNAAECVTDAINIAHTFLQQKPSIPKKPILRTTHTSDQAATYATALKDYEIAWIQHDSDMKPYYEQKNTVNQACEDYIKAVAEILNVPEKYRAKVYALASENGGYEDIYNKLCELVYIFT